MLQDRIEGTGDRIGRRARQGRAVALFLILAVFSAVLAGCAGGGGGGGGASPSPEPSPPPPTVSSVSPASGPLAGGMTVDIAGANLDGAAVTFGGVPATSAVVNDARTRVTAGVPAANNAGPVDVTVTNSRGSATASRGFMYNTPPTITFLSPASGPLGGGTNLTVLGTSFEGEVLVLVGGLPATAVSVNGEKTQVTCVVPAGTATGTVDVEVRCSLSGSARAPGAFAYGNGAGGEAPAISSVTPTRGPMTGGTTLVIFGARFLGNVAVTIGGRAATGVRVNDARTQITCITPASPDAGDVDVTVLSDRNGQATLFDGFFYNAALIASGIAPTAGPQAGGTTVTISGANFEGRITVTIGGRGAEVVSVDGARTEITARTPPSSSTGPKDVVIDSDTNGRASLPGAFTYNGPPPTLSSITPTTGPIRGGTLLTITGTGFRGNMSVTLGGVPCTGLTVNAALTRITCRTPATGATGAVDVVVASDTHGSVTAVGAFTYNANPAPTITAIAPTNGPLAGGNTVTVDGTNFLGAITLAFGGTLATGVTVASDTRLTAKVPSSASPGTVDVFLESDTHGGVTRTAAYTYNPAMLFSSVVPDRGPKFGDTPITVNGQNFFGAITMTIGGTQAPISAVAVDGLTITARTPGSATTGAKTIVIASSTHGNVTATSAFTYEENPPPTAGAITPDNGPITGGTVVRVQGTNFFGTVNVTVGGIDVGPVAVNGDATEVTFSTPAVPTPGNRTVLIGSSTHGVAPVPGGFFYNDPPTIGTVAPNNGPLAGGTRVRITGTDFGSTATVRFGGITGTSVVVNGPGEIDVTTPPRATPGAVDVQVSSPETGVASKANAFTYNPAATVTQATPNNGPLVGGNLVKLTGTNFGGTVTVSFGGIAATAPVTVTATEVTVAAPARGTPGPVDVRVDSSDNGPATLAGGYTYNPSATIVSPVSPAEGPLAGGTTVNITGTNFGGTVNVTIGGRTATDVVVLSSTSLRAKTPAGAAAGPVDVTIFSSANGPATLAGAFTYNPAPRIDTVVPNAGPQAGGQTVVISGNLFFGTVNVSFGSVPAVSVTPNAFRTQLTCVTGASPDFGLKDVTVSSSTHGSVTRTGAYTYIPPAPAILSVAPNQGGAAGGTAVTIDGANFEGTVNVTFGAASATDTVRVSPTRITCKTPPAAAIGAVNVLVGSDTHGVGTLVNGFTYNPTMTITSITPDEGPSGSTTNVQIAGSNFLGNITVTVGGTPATNVVVISQSQITATVPAAGGAGPQPLKVISDTHGEATATFNYNGTPVIGSLTPPSGPTAGGTDVDIAGSGFGGTIVVKIGDTFSTAPTAQLVSVNVSRTLIKIKTPANTAGPKNVFVQSSTNGQTTRTAGFTYNSPPSAANISPNEGPLSGGTEVLIVGSGFTGTVTVSVGGSPATILEALEGQIRLLTPSSTTTGTKDVVVDATGGGSTTVPNGFRYNDLPTVTGGVSPSSGPQQGGQTVTVNGTGFGGTVNVTVNGVPATNVVPNLTRTQLTFRTAPTATPGTGDVVIGSTTNGQVTLTGAYTYNPSPQLTAIIPDDGPQSGNQLVTVTGQNFGGTVTATIGGNAMTGIVVQSPTQFTGRTPPSLSAGLRDLAVSSTTNGTATLVGAYTYNLSAVITGLSPDNGPLAGGNTVIITGANFEGTVNVSIGNAPAIVQSVNAAKTQVTITAPAGSGAGAATLTVNSSLNGVATATYTYNPQVSITNVNPNNGPTSGGTTVILTGLNFINVTQVLVDTVSVTFTRNSQTQITLTTPARIGAPGPVDVEVISTTHGSGIAPDGFVYNPETAIFDVVPDEGPLVGANLVDIVGDNFATPLTVRFGGVLAPTVSVTPQQVRVRAPARATAGSVDVLVDSTPNGPFTLVNGYTYNATPTGLTITPDNGPLQGGNQVIIVGTDFRGTVTALIGGRNVTITNISGDRSTITALAPPGAAPAAVDVAVHASATGSVTKTGGYTYNPQLTVSSFLPNQGPVTGGTTVTIIGTNLLGPLTVDIGTLTTANVTQVVTGTQVQVLTPTSPVTGTFNVTVSSTTHGSATIANGFTYNPVLDVTAIAPDNGPISGGTTVNITGTGMFGVNDVKFGGQSAQAGSVSVNPQGTLVTARTPPGLTAGPKDVLVISPTHGRDTLPQAFTYNPEFVPGALVNTDTPRALVTKDFNGDGKVDVAVANQIADTVTVFLNDGEPGGPPVLSNTGNVSFTAGNEPTGIDAADIDGDLRPDLIVANKLSNNITINLNFTQPGTNTVSFSGPGAFGIGGGPSAVVAADFNGDGKQDIAVTGELAPFVRVRGSLVRNPGSVTLGGSLSFACGAGPAAIVSADFNNDGKPDLATANKDDSTITVLRNNTVTQDANILTGTVASFAAPVTISMPAGSSTQGLCAADFDGDGKADLACANAVAGNVTVFLNTTPNAAAAPSFGPAKTFAAVGTPPAIIAGDIDRDGRMDIVTANDGDPSVSFRLSTTIPNSGNPTFAGRSDIPAGTAPRTIGVADFNGDGRLEIITANRLSSSVQIFLHNTPLGSPPSATSTPADRGNFNVGDAPTNVTLADVDRDGRLDVISSNDGSANYSILANDTTPGATTFTLRAPVNGTAGANPSDVATLDIDGEGRPDFVVANRVGQSLTATLNTVNLANRTIAFGATSNTNLGMRAAGLAVADFSLDGRPDVVVSSGNATVVMMLRNITTLNGGTPQWAPLMVFTGAGPRGVAMGDFNGDYLPDLVAANSSSDTITVILNNTVPGSNSPSFPASRRADFPTDLTPTQVTLLDYNGDGKLDIAVSNQGASNVSVFRNETPPGNLTPVFAGRTEFPTAAGPVGITARDFDGDGVADLVVGASNANVATILLNGTLPGDASPPVFTDRVDIPVGTSPQGVAVGDLNGDGRADGAAAALAVDQVTLIRNFTNPNP